MATWVMETIYATRYLGLVLLMFIENVFPPIPSEVIMPLAGFMATQDRLSFLGVVVAGGLGSVLGALPLYYLGRAIGEERLKRAADAYGRWLTVSRQDLDKAQQWFERHGGMAVLFGRFVPGVRSLISVPAGIAQMSLVTFLAYTAIGSVGWAAILAALGYGLGAQFPRVEEYLNPVSYVVLAGIVAMYLYRVFTHAGARQGPERQEQKVS
jgi:membrane protein DedA with SNARE-associated domain